MKKAYFIFNKKNGSFYDSIPYETKDDAYNRIAMTKAHYRLSKGCGHELNVMKDQIPEDTRYYKSSVIGDHVEYYWDYNKFDRKVWKPYVKSHFEIRKIKYEIHEIK